MLTTTHNNRLAHSPSHQLSIALPVLVFAHTLKHFNLTINACDRNNVLTRVLLDSWDGEAKLSCDIEWYLALMKFDVFIVIVYRFFLQSPANPDILYVVLFLHTQLTTTVTLAFLFGSKVFIRSFALYALFKNQVAECKQLS